MCETQMFNWRHAPDWTTRGRLPLPRMQLCLTLHVCLQEAQLPLRNRASAMYIFVAKLLSIAVMTYVYHIRNRYVWQICYARSE